MSESSIKHPFAAPDVKIQRATKHLAELESEIHVYLASRPIVFEVDLNQETKSVRVHMEVVRPLPPALGAIIGDIVHNLRAALDLMACDAVKAVDGNAEGVYFPFCEEPKYLATMVKKRKFDRAGPDAVSLVMELKPYAGGNVPLRALHDLDIQDKHQSLIPSIMAFASPVIAAKDDTFCILGEDHSAPSSFKLNFPSNSALAGQEIIPTLHELVKTVAGIVEAFRALANRASP